MPVTIDSLQKDSIQFEEDFLKSDHQSQNDAKTRHKEIIEGYDELLAQKPAKKNCIIIYDDMARQCELFRTFYGRLYDQERVLSKKEDYLKEQIDLNQSSLDYVEKEIALCSTKKDKKWANGYKEIYEAKKAALDKHKEQLEGAITLEGLNSSDSSSDDEQPPVARRGASIEAALVMVEGLSSPSARTELQLQAAIEAVTNLIKNPEITQNTYDARLLGLAHGVLERLLEQNSRKRRYSNFIENEEESSQDGDESYSNSSICTK